MKTKNHHAVALGRIGGQTTGPTKARKVTSAMAKKAADARWAKRKLGCTLDEIEATKLAVKLGK